MVIGRDIGEFQRGSDRRRRRLAAILMRIALCAISASLVADAAQAESADRFDLNCHGVVIKWNGSKRTTSAWETTYHVDVKSAKICHDECLAPDNINDGRSDVIQLLNIGTTSAFTNRTELVDKIDIDRYDGIYNRDHYWDEITTQLIMGDVVVMHHDEYHGHCDLREFTAFPVTIF